MHFILTLPTCISHYSPTDVSKSYVHDHKLSAELHINGTVYATLAIRWSYILNYKYGYRLTDNLQHNWVNKQ